jgi:hypothetical protein
MSTCEFAGAVRSIVLGFCVAIGTAGCASIHSSSVRDLIDKESEKIGQATANAKDFVKQTDDRNKSYQAAVSALDKSAQALHTNEALFSLIFSSSQNVESKSGIDALAVAYLAGVLYLSDQAGLDKAVKDQFTADFGALSDLSKKIHASWESIGELQTKVQTYSRQTGIASVDPDLVAALLKQAKVDTSEIDAVLSRSKQLNDGLQGLTKNGVLGSGALEREQQSITDFVDLLNKVKK